MAPSAISTTTTRLGRVVHRLFLSRRAVVAVMAVEATAALVGLPPLLHAVS